jgi:hypothetical protein
VSKLKEMVIESGINPHSDSIQKIKHLAVLIRRDERERCAKVCEDLFDVHNDDWNSLEGASKCAAAIRSMK